jgi:hypothetical protein
MERCALYGMMQQGAVASWVLLSRILHMLQKYDVFSYLLKVDSIVLS